MSNPKTNEQLKILMITSRLPYPLDKGDKLRAYHQCKYLNTSHLVHLMSIVDDDPEMEDIEHLASLVHRFYCLRISHGRRLRSLILSLFHKLPLQVAWFYDPKAKSFIAEEVTKIKPDIIICQLARTAPYLPETKVFKVLDFMDAFGIGMEKRADISMGIRKWIYKFESKRMRAYESNIATLFDKLIVISEPDKNRIQIPENSPKLEVIPNGIDDQFFNYPSGQKKYDLTFVGNLGYLPNIEAAEYLVRYIMPLLPIETTLLISGRNPHQRIKKLISNNVTVIGDPKDIRPSYAQAKVFCAPIWSGTGQQNKILESMAMGVTCITTTAVNAAIGAIEGQQIMIAESAREFADGIIKLLHNDEKRLQMAKDARDFAQKKYQWIPLANALIENTLD
jgi:glycosyltransferase involved in cell wall biosynthesis